METISLKELSEQIRQQSLPLQELRRRMEISIIGQEDLIHKMLISILANGHLLLEGVPGLGKTLTIKTLAQLIRSAFARIQFTPDLLPGDIVGTPIFQPKDGTFIVKKGPIFANFVLADEINRAPAKTQSALLEAMQERQITIGDETFLLDEPFFVLATQNPIEQEGTYPLPEAQVDRFLMKLKVTYPNKKAELDILELYANNSASAQIPKSFLEPNDILIAQQTMRQIYLDPKLKDYIIEIIFASRFPQDHNLAKLKPLIAYGASPRATLFLAQASKGSAFLDGRGYATPEDIRFVATDILRHRILLTYEAEAENVTPEDIINEIFETISVP
ncbi:MAG: MoxR family ATPase [Elusimicrobia bacterium]|nr:MoxR family ATPase [Elusimicrobiota bacterium]